MGIAMFGQNILKTPLFYGPGSGDREPHWMFRGFGKDKPALTQLAEQAEPEPKENEDDCKAV